MEEETRGASQVREWKRSADERGITGEGVEEETRGASQVGLLLLAV